MSSIAMPSFSRRSRKQGEDFRLCRHIESGRRLVGDQQARLASERDGKKRALAHAARQFMRIGARERLSAI